MRDTFVRTLIEQATENQDIELITGDLGFGVLKPFWETLPNQFTNAGIAEQNMTTVAAGMALEGKTVVTYSIGNFPTIRCLEQIRNDCAYHQANVKVVCVGGGFAYGSLGMSHHATEDVALLRALPGVTVFCPGDLMEAIEVTKAMLTYPGTCYLRLGRGGEKQVHDKIKNFSIGKAIKIRDAINKDKKIALFSTGAILAEVCKAADGLENASIGVEQYSFPTVKPLDSDTIRDCAHRYDYIVTVEEHNVVGGFGSAVAEVMAETAESSRLIRLGLNDEYCTIVGSQDYLRGKYGLSAEKIIERVEEAVNG